MTHPGSRIYQEDLAYIHDVGFGDLARRAAPAVVTTLRSRGLDQGTIVELGCGIGILLAGLSGAGYQTVGIDLKSATITVRPNYRPAGWRSRRSRGVVIR